MGNKFFKSKKGKLPTTTTYCVEPENPEALQPYEIKVESNNQSEQQCDNCEDKSLCCEEQCKDDSLCCEEEKESESEEESSSDEEPEAPEEEKKQEIDEQEVTEEIGEKDKTDVKEKTEEEKEKEKTEEKDKAEEKDDFSGVLLRSLTKEQKKEHKKKIKE